jgi:TatD DNase family protein
VGLSSQVYLSDTHCHLDFDAFDDDREATLDRAKRVGVNRILVPGIDLVSSRSAVSLAEAYLEVYAAVGVHPNDALKFDENTLTELRHLVFQGDAGRHPKIVAIGEIGLDYYRDRAPHQLQHKLFQYQLELAAELELPVVIHNRQASADILEIITAWQAGLQKNGSPLAERPGVLHSFSGDLEIARRATEHNFYIGITGPVTFKNARELQEVVASAPLERLLIETDAPFLTPHPHRGQRNEPAHVHLVAEAIASLKSTTISVVSAQTSENARRLFNW